jgi:hypothetical protein
MGMGTADEVIDTYGEPMSDTPAALMPGSTKALEAELMGNGQPRFTTDGEVLRQ